MSGYIRPSRLDHCGGCGAEVARSGTSAAVIYCRACRAKGLAPRKLAHGTPRMYRAGCRCVACREDNNRRGREQGRKARARGYVRPGRRGIPDVACDWCGEHLLCRTESAKYHKECRPKALHAAARRRAAERRLAKAQAGVPANPNWPFTVGVCRYCSEHFVRRNRPSPYCSSRCRRKDAPDPVRPSDRRIVFERDGFVCQLCDEPTEPDADPLSDWYPTVDHIVPQSKGGGHEPENLRCAHRWCNSVRGDDTYYTIAILRRSEEVQRGGIEAEPPRSDSRREAAVAA